MARVAEAIICIVQIQRDAWVWDIRVFRGNELVGLQDDNANKSDGWLNSEVYPQMFSSSREAHWKGSCGILFVGVFSVVCESNPCSYNGGYELGALKHSNPMEVRSTADSRKICSWFSGLSKKFQTHAMVFLFSELSLGFLFHQSIFCPRFPY